MQICGGCGLAPVNQVVTVLANPVTWLVMGTLLTSVWPKKKAGKK